MAEASTNPKPGRPHLEGSRTTLARSPRKNTHEKTSERPSADAGLLGNHSSGIPADLVWPLGARVEVWTWLNCTLEAWAGRYGQVPAAKSRVLDSTASHSQSREPRRCGCTARLMEMHVGHVVNHSMPFKKLPPLETIGFATGRGTERGRLVWLSPSRLSRASLLASLPRTTAAGGLTSLT